MKTYKKEIAALKNGKIGWSYNKTIMRITGKNIQAKMRVGNDPWVVDLAPLDDEGRWSGPMESVVVRINHPLYNVMVQMRKILACQDQIERSEHGAKSAQFRVIEARKSLKHNLAHAANMRSTITNMEARIKDMRAGGDGTLGDGNFPFKV